MEKDLGNEGKSRRGWKYVSQKFLSASRSISASIASWTKLFDTFLTDERKEKLGDSEKKN